MDGIKLNAEDIINYLKKDGFNNNCTMGVSEFCPYGEGRRLDLFYFNRWNRETKGYEIKVSKEDFLQDHKWQTYLKFCTRFYFIAPTGIIKLEELPDEIGLMEIDVVGDDESILYYKIKHGEIEDGEQSYSLKRKFTKRAKKLHDVAEKEYIQLLEGLLIKIMYQKNIVL